MEISRALITGFSPFDDRVMMMSLEHYIAGTTHTTMHFLRCSQGLVAYTVKLHRLANRLIGKWICVKSEEHLCEFISNVAIYVRLLPSKFTTGPYRGNNVIAKYESDPCIRGAIIGQFCDERRAADTLYYATIRQPSPYYHGSWNRRIMILVGKAGFFGKLKHISSIPMRSIDIDESPAAFVRLAVIRHLAYINDRLSIESDPVLFQSYTTMKSDSDAMKITANCDRHIAAIERIANSNLEDEQVYNDIAFLTGSPIPAMSTIIEHISMKGAIINPVLSTDDAEMQTDVIVEQNNTVTIIETNNTEYAAESLYMRIRVAILAALYNHKHIRLVTTVIIIDPSHGWIRVFSLDGWSPTDFNNLLTLMNNNCPLA